MTTKETLELLKQYAKAVDEQFQTGIAREHAYRPALHQLLKDLLPQCVVTNEPARIQCGAPDYIITQKKTEQPVFFVEAKDVFDADLDGIRGHKEQFDRYKASLDYIIFTDYLDFHVYEHGEWQQNVRLIEQQGKHLRLIEGAVEAFVAMVEHLASSRPQSITSATKLAQQMAAKARLLADAVRRAFAEAEETQLDNSQLQAQLNAFRNILIHDLTPEGFADIYAQTIAYGMFAARLHDESVEDFSRHEAATLIPKTNPFLRTIFQQIAGYDLDERIAWIVDDLAQTFLATNLDKVMKTYTGNALHSDPMIHFYEDFLSAYDPKLRKSKGVWYTPQPVVNFIVRAVDEILQRDFHLPMGLADKSKAKHEVINDYYDGKKGSQKTITREEHRVQILDPATGTGTFLAEIVRQIYQKFQGKEGMWQGYVEEHLLPRLHGFELLMASYAVAHLKLDLQLRGMGYDSAKAKNQRLRIYLTNSLEECHPDTGSLWANWLSQEATEANHIKRDCPVMVMVGNPPYSVSSSNNSSWILSMLEKYKDGLNEQKININDDYIKFIRLAQDYIERNKKGVIGFITNNSFVDGLTHRKMRYELMRTFDKIYILNLHGNSKKKETCPDGSKDENVFDIMQGVSINIFVKTGQKKEDELGKVYHKDLFGMRENKYDFLETHKLADVGYEELQPQAPMYFYSPKDFGLEAEYQTNVGVKDLFQTNSTGVESQKDEFCIAHSMSEIRQRIIDLCNFDYASIKEKYSQIQDGAAWTLANAQKAVRPNIEDEKIIPISVFPFDVRYTYYKQGFLARTREKALKHMLHDNSLSLIVPRQSSQGWHHVFCSEYVSNGNLLASAKLLGSGTQFPLYLYTETIEGEQKVPNLNRDEWAKFDAAVGRATTPEELLHYIYGVLHSPSYRERYKEFLKIDFPRIPLPESEAEFVSKGAIGKQLIDLHLMRDTHTWPIATTFPAGGDCMVDAIRYADGCVWINNTQYFGNVPEAAWNAYIGGYQPAQKWLKDRKGRTLSFDDLDHYQRVIYALTETQRLMAELG